MSDKINLLQRASEIEISPQFDGVTKLVCQISDDSEMTAGTDTGYTLEFSDPMMTQETLNAMLEKIRGYQYQPYRVDGAILDPAAEMGDAVSTQKLSAGIFSRSRTFGTLMKADISAPTDQEIEHEYKFETREERSVRRQVGGFKASLQVLAEGIEAEAEERTAMGDEFRGQLEIQATAIEAKVSSDTSANKSTFGWKLTDSSWILYGNNSTILKATQSGLEVTGKITATSGEIGGLTIGKDDNGNPALYVTARNFTGTSKTGIHISSQGIRIGQNFKASANGDVLANNLRLSGTLTFINGTNESTLSAPALRSGAVQGSSAYGTWQAAQDTSRGTDIVATYLNVKSRFFIMNGTTVEFIPAPSLGGYVLGTRGEG